MGIGELLILDSLRRAFEQTAHIGAGFVLVPSIVDPAMEFYERSGFSELPDQARRLYLAMPTVAQLFGEESRQQPTGGYRHSLKLEPIAGSGGLRYAETETDSASTT